MITYREKKKPGKAAVAAKMWEKVGEESTAKIFANVAFYLAAL